MLAVFALIDGCSAECLIAQSRLFFGLGVFWGLSNADRYDNHIQHALDVFTFGCFDVLDLNVGRIFLAKLAILSWQ